MFVNSVPRGCWCVICFGLAVTVLGACTMQGVKNDGDEQESEMDGEEARAAIIALVERSDHEELKMSIPFLRTTTIEQVGSDPAVVHIGRWQFDLKKRTFVVTVDAPPIFAEYQGVFQNAPGKGWTASFTDIKRN